MFSCEVLTAVASTQVCPVVFQADVVFFVFQQLFVKRKKNLNEAETIATQFYTFLLDNPKAI